MDRDDLDLTSTEQVALFGSKKTESKGGVKFDQGKVRYSLIPVNSLKAIAQVLTVGAKKYGDRNWEQGIMYSRVYDALQRHLNAWWGGEENDPDDGLHHLAHAGCNVLFLLAFCLQGRPVLDDRPVFQ